MPPAKKRKVDFAVDPSVTKNASGVPDKKEDNEAALALAAVNGPAVDIVAAAAIVAAPENVRRFLECPVCLEVRCHTHILQCISGHNICAVCKANKSIVVCPTCRQGYSDPPTRNFTVESLIEASDLEDFACKYAGCGFSGKRAQLGDHEADCESRMVPCPNGFCHKKVEAKDMLKHLRTDHKETIWRNSERNNWLLKADLPPIYDWILTVYDFDGRTFIHRFKKSSTTGYYHAWVTILGGPKLAAGYSVVISATKGGSEIKKVCKVHAVDREEQDITGEEDCYIIGEAQVKQMRTDNAAEATKTIYPHLITITYHIQNKAMAANRRRSFFFRAQDSVASCPGPKL